MNVIAQAVEPLRSAAIERAVKYAQDILEAMSAQLALGGRDLNVVAPRPSSNMGRAEYVAARRRRERFESVTRPVAPVRNFREPCIVEWDQAAADRFVEMASEDASIEFDLYVGKLSAKVGEAAEASVTGDLWSYSTLTVTKPDGSVERWRTQQILNVSSLGKVFNQWPTRKVK